MEVVNTAVIGLGSRGLGLADMYSQRSHVGFDLRAVCDLDRARWEHARAVHGRGLACYADMHEMLDREDIDAVIVATGDPHHVEPTLAALANGKHVLVEKPLCQSVDDAQRLVAAARASRGILMIGFELRATSVFREMKTLLDQGRIGEVKLGHAFDNVSVGGDYFFHDPMRQKAFFKSLLLQKACHSLDLLNWLMGTAPATVYAVGGLGSFGGNAPTGLRCHACGKSATCPYYLDKDHVALDYGAPVSRPDYCVWSSAMDLDDHALLCITYANGAKATFQECHFTPEYTREFWLVGTEGKMYGFYDNPGNFRIRIGRRHSQAAPQELRPPREEGDHGGGDNNLREEFHRRIVENAPAPDALESAYYATVLAICAGESIASGGPVAIPPLG